MKLPRKGSKVTAYVCRLDMELVSNMADLISFSNKKRCQSRPCNNCKGEDKIVLRVESVEAVR